MAPQPLNSPQTAAFPVSKLAPLLRAVADPDGSGEVEGDEALAIARIEANVSRSAYSRGDD